MIRYPREIKYGDVIGVTAPSSGVPKELHSIVTGAIKQFEKRGYHIQVGKTVWTNEKATSADGECSCERIKSNASRRKISAIIPPWGGEILMEIFPLIEWDAIQPKWILGYSDTSTLLFTLTLMTGIATAHGTNLVDLRSDQWDNTTIKFLDVLTATEGAVIEQSSSEKYQSDWNHDKAPNPYVFELNTLTSWKTLSAAPVKMDGRLLGGCIDTIQKSCWHSLFRCKYI